MENPSNNKIRFIPIKTSNAAEDPLSSKEEEKHDMSEDDPEFLPEMSNSQKKRQSYPIDVKLEVIEYAKKTSRHAAARHFGISRKCISQWVAVEERLREFKNVTAKGAKLRLPGAGRRVQKPETDEGEKVRSTFILVILVARGRVGTDISGYFNVRTVILLISRPTATGSWII